MFVSALKMLQQGGHCLPTQHCRANIAYQLATLLLALVKLFTLLFLAAVKERLKFEQGPLKQAIDRWDVASTSSSRERAEFVKQFQEILYS